MVQMNYRMTDRAIIHLDLDAFFVAVERLDSPALVGLPVIVGGRPETAAWSRLHRMKPGLSVCILPCLPHRRCASARRPYSYRATAGAMSRCSRRVMRILADYTPLLEPMSIDEAFLDVSGTDAHYGPPAALARALQDRIQAELGLSASLGVAANKLVAKIASDFRKPHGITVVAPGDEARFLAPLPIRRLWGIGDVTAGELARLGIGTIGDLAQRPLEDPKSRFGAHGEGMWRAAHGIDEIAVTPEHEAKSLSREATFASDVGDLQTLRRELLRQCDAVCKSPAPPPPPGRTVTLKLRYADFTTVTRQITLGESTDAGPTIYMQVLSLFEAAWNRRQPVRLLGVGVSGLTQSAGQLRLFEQQDHRQAELDVALDRIRDRFGYDAIQRASLVEPPDELWVGRSLEED